MSKKNIPLPKKTKERLLALKKSHDELMEEARKIEIAINELIFGVRDGMDIGDNFVLNEIEVGFVEKEKQEDED